MFEEFVMIVLGFLLLAWIPPLVIAGITVLRMRRRLETRIDRLERTVERRLARFDTAPARAETVEDEPDVPVEDDRPAVRQTPEDEPEQHPPVVPGHATIPPPPGVESADAASAGGGSETADGLGVGLEDLLGARLPVWIGSIALLLAGVFLVRYSIDQGWIGPIVRVTLGALLGGALLVAGEWSGRVSDRIAAGLSAAGIGVLYATFFAATQLYGLVSNGVGFGLMGLTTAAAVALSLRRGPAVAIIGLVGGFLTPQLLRGASAPHPAPLLAYLVLLQVGLLIVADRRRWTWLAGLTFLPAFLWVLPWLSAPASNLVLPWLRGYLAISAVLYIAVSVRSAGSATTEEGSESPWGLLTDRLATLGIGAAVVLAVALAARSGWQTADWLYLGLLSAGAMVYGRMRPDRESVPWAVAAFIALALLNWGSDIPLPGESLGGVDDWVSAGRFVATVAALGTLFGIGALVAIRGSGRRIAWSALASASAVGYFLVAYATVVFVRSDIATGGVVPGTPIPWGAAAVGVGTVLAAAASVLAGRAGHSSDHRKALAVLTAGAAAMAALAVPIELQREWIAVAWALQLAAMVWIAVRLDTPELRWVAWGLAGLVAVRLLLNPAVVFDYPIGDRPIVNWITYGYLLPAVACGWSAVHARGRLTRRLAEVLAWLTIALVLAWSTLSVAQWFNPAGPLVHDPPWLEWAVWPVAWSLLAVAISWLHRRTGWDLDALRLAGPGLLAIATWSAIAFQLTVANPFLVTSDVGNTTVLNWLLLALVVPATLALVGRRIIPPAESLPVGTLVHAALGIGALLLGFLWATYTVRQGFRGPDLSVGTSSAAERYGYSMAWILYGAALLAVGVLKRNALARRGSLAVMVLAVLKVFLYDTANLDDLYRVLSYLGLGVSLLLLAWVYQRFVFTGAPDLPPDAPPVPSESEPGHERRESQS